MASSVRWGDFQGANLESLAQRLHPLRWLLVTCALATALIGMTPLLCVVHFAAVPPRAVLLVGVSLIPFALWPLGALLLAEWFEPRRGVLGRENESFRACPKRLQTTLRVVAQIALAGFALGPFVVFAAR